MNKLQEVREKIIEAVPEIVEHETCRCGYREHPVGVVCSDGSLKLRPITLADVLRAIDACRENVKGDIEVHLFGEMYFTHTEPDGYVRNAYWNLALPLDEQEPEVIEFLHKILCV